MAWSILFAGRAVIHTLKSVSLKVLIPLLVVGVLVSWGLWIFSRRLAITILLIALGFSMVWRTTWFLGAFGRVPWAEAHLTSSFGAGLGGSWMWYKLLGILVIVVAILYLSGVLQVLLVNTLGTFFGSAFPE